MHCAGAQLMSQLCVCAAKLAAEQRQALMRWLRELPADQFGARNVRPLQRHISGLARRQVACFGRPILVTLDQAPG